MIRELLNKYSENSTFTANEKNAPLAGFRRLGERFYDEKQLFEIEYGSSVLNFESCIEKLAVF